MIPEYSIDKSNVFGNAETYELELEFNPKHNNIITQHTEIEKQIEISSKLIFEGVKMALSVTRNKLSNFCRRKRICFNRISKNH